MSNNRRNNPTLRALAHLELFGSCTHKQLAALLPNTDVITVAAGTVIDRSGTRARQFVGIIDGYVEALDDDGQSTVLGPGDHIGAAELLDQRAHRATYTTITASSVVVTLGRAFSATARSLPDVVARSIGATSRPAIRELALVG